MSGKSVLITGANGGIGLATVKLFLEKGYTVFAHYFRSDGRLKTLPDDGRLKMIQGDLSKAEEVKKVFDRCMAQCPKLDVLFNNAGTLLISDGIEQIPEKDFDYVFSVNLKAPFLLSQLALGHMKTNKGGCIVNISSIGVKYGGNPASASYTVSKGAVETMTRAFAKAGAAYGVRVNAVRAGLTDTDFLKRNPKKDLSKRVGLIPMQRMAEPEEIAAAVYYLASEKSSYVTGTILTIAGGE